MIYLQVVIFGIICFSMVACNGSDEGEAQINTLTLGDFSAEVKGSVSQNAINCGVVVIGESDLDVNTCAAESFSNMEEFYAIYHLQGFDSSVGAAITRENDGAIYVWSFDSSPSGGVPLSNSHIDREKCIDPELSGTVDSGYREIFLCAEP